MLPLPRANTGFLYREGRGASEILPTSQIPSRVGQKKIEPQNWDGMGTGPRGPHLNRGDLSIWLLSPLNSNKSSSFYPL